MGLEELFIDDKIKRLRKKEKRLLTILLITTTVLYIISGFKRGYKVER